MKYSLSNYNWDHKEIDAIQETLKSGFLTIGKKVSKFEKSFAKYTGSKYAVMVNSGSSANLLMLSALKLFSSNDKKNNKNIIAPAIGWSTSYYPINQNGYKIKFVDVELDTYNISVEESKKAIDDNTEAIIAINILGNPSNLNKLKKLCNEKKIILLEDNCESFGGKIKKKHLGTFGLMGTYSFYFSHHISTIEGGMIVTNNKKYYEALLSLRAHGWIRDLPSNNSLYKKTGDTFIDSFKFILPGYCLRPTEINAAAGIEQLKKFPKFLKIRRSNAEVAKKLFKDSIYMKLQTESDYSSWFGFGFLLQNKFKNRRDFLVKKLKSFNIETRPIVSGNFVNNPVIKYLNYSKSNLKNAETIEKRGFFVGNHDIDLSKELKFLKKCCDSILS